MGGDGGTSEPPVRKLHCSGGTISGAGNPPAVMVQQELPGPGLFQSSRSPQLTQHAADKRRRHSVCGICTNAGGGLAEIGFI